MAADYDFNLARSVIHDAVGKLESAQNYLTRAAYDSGVSTEDEVLELRRILVRLQRLNNNLLTAGDEALFKAELRK